MLKRTTLFICFIAFAFFVYKQKTNSPAQVKTGWEKFEKTKKSFNAAPAKISDLENHKVIAKKRTPASVPSMSMKTKRNMRSGRYLEGRDVKKYTNPTEPLTFKNKVRADWKKKLGHNLVRFQPEGTEVLVKKESSIIYVKNSIAEYREKVLVSYKLPNGKNTSYRAIVNSDDGRVIYKFDRTINEDFRNRPAGLTHPLAQ